MEQWTASMTARERVTTIATTLSHPRTANWIADQADVTWDTAKTHLDDLAESGVVLKTDDGAYVPDPTRAYFDELRELILTNEKTELRRELESIAERIDDWQETYDIDSIDDFEATLADDLPADEIRERRRVLRRWETSRQSRDLIRNALLLYDDVQSLTESIPESPPVEGLG